jgi:hypothetical protein
MKIMILGLGKSGTTALLYKLAAGLPGCHAFSGGMPGKYIGDYGDAVYKQNAVSMEPGLCGAQAAI